MKLITRKLKLNDVIDKKTVKALSGYGVTKDSEFLRKGLEVSDVIFTEGERSAINTITTSRPDRDRDIVRPDGGIFGPYLKHPVVLAGHDYSLLPIGRNEWLKLNDDGSGIVGKTTYASHAKADDYYQYRKDGFPMAVSIGFIPLEGYSKGEREFNQNAKDMMSKGWITKDDLENTDRIFTKWILLEYSDVSVPSNPEALQIAVSKNFMPGYEAPFELEDGDPVVETTSYEEYKHSPNKRKFMIVDNGSGYVPDDKEIDGYMKAAMPKTEYAKKTDAADDKEYIMPLDKSKGGVINIDLDAPLPTDEQAHEMLKDAMPKTEAPEEAEGFMVSPDGEEWRFLPLTKTIDADKQPSVGDIRQAIYFTLNNNSLVNDSQSHIIDLYPIDYPSGHAVIAMYIENLDGSLGQERFVDWKYIMADGVATLHDAKEVNEQWAVKGLKQELNKQLGIKVEKTFRISPSPKKKTVNKEEAMAIIKAGITANVNSANEAVNKMIADAKHEMETKVALAKGRVVYTKE